MSKKQSPDQAKKLDLAKRTLRKLSLSERELGQVAGGTRTRTTQVPPTA